MFRALTFWSWTDSTEAAASTVHFQSMSSSGVAITPSQILRLSRVITDMGSGFGGSPSAQLSLSRPAGCDSL